MNAKPNQLWTLVRAVLILIPCSVLAGFFASELSNLLYFVLLFPIGLGLVGAALLAATLKKFEISAPWQATCLGLLTALTIYAVYHYADYLIFRLLLSSKMQVELFAGSGTAAPQVASAFVDYALQQETGSAGLLGFLLYQAQTGISLGSWYGGIQIHLGPMLTWAYWALECGLVAWLTVRARAMFSK